jgi:hypothetical protein
MGDDETIGWEEEDSSKIGLEGDEHHGFAES